MFKDFGKRLQRDIKRMVDARIKMSEITSQANMTSGQIQAKQLDVNVISHRKQRYAVWFGGSLLADTVFTLIILFNNFNAFRLISLVTAIQRPNMKNMDLESLDIIRFLDRFFEVLCVKIWDVWVLLLYFRRYKKKIIF